MCKISMALKQMIVLGVDILLLFPAHNVQQITIFSILYSLFHLNQVACACMAALLICHIVVVFFGWFSKFEINLWIITFLTWTVLEYK